MLTPYPPVALPDSPQLADMLASQIVDVPATGRLVVTYSMLVKGPSLGEFRLPTPAQVSARVDVRGNAGATLASSAPFTSPQLSLHGTPEFFEQAVDIPVTAGSYYLALAVSGTGTLFNAFMTWEFVAD